MIKAVTFDLWDTVIRDDSDEPKRAAAGLPTKAEQRRRLAAEAFRAGAPSLGEADVARVYDAMEAGFDLSWHGYHATWSVGERVSVLEAGLGTALASGARAELVRRLEEMELEVEPDPVPGIEAAIADLAGRYRLAVVSDAIYSPGRCLRTWLDRHGLLGHFAAFAFSDEVGRSKPDPAMFEAAARGLDARPDELVHVGDREPNDVAGPHRVGARAILFTAARDRGSAGTRADAICRDAADLPRLVDDLAARAR